MKRSINPRYKYSILNFFTIFLLLITTISTSQQSVNTTRIIENMQEVNAENALMYQLQSKSEYQNMTEYQNMPEYAKESEELNPLIFSPRHWVSADSVLNKNQYTVSKKYGFKRFNEKQLSGIDQLGFKAKAAIFVVFIGFIVLLILRIDSYKKLYITSKHQKLNYNKILETENSKIELNESKNNSNSIPNSVRYNLLKKLDRFEKNNDFLCKNLTLNSLAKDFKTNSSYLSGVINQEKRVNFSTYLKELRINNAIKSIENTSEYSKYSINGIAEEFGFNTAESFSKAFTDKIGIKPSCFLRELNKKEDQHISND